MAVLIRFMGMERPAQALWRGFTRLRARLGYPRSIRHNGEVIRIPTIAGFRCGFSETWMLELLRHILRIQGGTFLDVGANLGQTLIKVKAEDPQRDYVGFEPNPACNFYLSELIEANSFDHCLILPVGLYTQDAIVPLLCVSADQVDSAASVVPGFRPDEQIVARRFVPVVSFKSVEKLLGERSVGIIKIDVEGAELEVIETLMGVLRCQRPILFLETLPVYSEMNIFRLERQANLTKLFDEAGYRIFRIKKAAGGGFAGLQKIESFGIHSDLRLCDYLLLPKEKVQRVHAEIAPTKQENRGPEWHRDKPLLTQIGGLR